MRREPFRERSKGIRSEVLANAVSELTERVTGCPCHVESCYNGTWYVMREYAPNQHEEV